MTERTTWLSTLPILALGFRPFYLLAAIFAAAALPIWIGTFFGIIPVSGYLTGIAWHSNEMVFGFATAVMAGFLLTAVRNWTGLGTPEGGALAVLVLLWILGRVLMLTGPAGLAAAVDLLFLPALAIAVAIPIARSRNTRNFKVIAVLVAFMIANAGFHLAQLGVFSVDIGRLSVIAALDIVVILMAIIAGRVIPAFTANALPGVHPRNIYGVEVVALGSLILILVAEVASYWYLIPALIWFGLFITAFVAHATRLLLWCPFQTRHNALLLMLPVAYAWIPLALLLRAISVMPVGVSVTTAFHALTIGAMASLMMAMMTRSALGHTGRPLKAGRTEIGAYLLLQAAAVTRILPGFLWPQSYRAIFIVSATLWSLAFVVFLCGYWTALTRERIDGKSG